MPTEPTVLRLIFEYALITRPITPAMAEQHWGSPEKATGGISRAQQLAYERRLAEVVDADPALRRQVAFNEVYSGVLPQLEHYENVDGLLKHAYQPLLELLLSRLPEPEQQAIRAYCETYDLLGEGSDHLPLAELRVGLSLNRVLVEDEHGTIANSDERVRAVRKKRSDARKEEKTDN